MQMPLVVRPNYRVLTIATSKHMQHRLQVNLSIAISNAIEKIHIIAKTTMITCDCFKMFKQRSTNFMFDLLKMLCLPFRSCITFTTYTKSATFTNSWRDFYFDLFSDTNTPLSRTFPAILWNDLTLSYTSGANGNLQNKKNKKLLCNDRKLQ